MECVVSSLIIVGGVRCFFFNYCWWSALFLLQLLLDSALFLLQLLLVDSALFLLQLLLCVVSSSIIVGGSVLFLLQLLLWSASFLLQLLLV